MFDLNTKLQRLSLANPAAPRFTLQQSSQQLSAQAKVIAQSSIELNSLQLFPAELWHEMILPLSFKDVVALACVDCDLNAIACSVIDQKLQRAVQVPITYLKAYVGQDEKQIGSIKQLVTVSQKVSDSLSIGPDVLQKVIILVKKVLPFVHLKALQKIIQEERDCHFLNGAFTPIDDYRQKLKQARLDDKQLQGLCQNLLDDGYIAKAKRVAQKIIDYRCKGAVLYSVVRSLLLIGDIEDAIDVAQKIDNPELKFVTLKNILENLIAKDDIEQAKNQAKNIAKRSENADLCPQLLGLIGKALLLKDDVEGAKEIAASICDTKARSRLHHAIVKNLLLKGDIEGAKEIAPIICNEAIRLKTLRKIAMSLWTKNDIEEVQEIAEKLNEYDRSTLYLKIGKGLLLKGDIEGAIGIFKTILNCAVHDNQAYWEQKVCKVSLLHGNIRESREITGAIGVYELKSNLLGKVSRILARQGNIQKAIEAIHLIEDFEHRQISLYNLIEVLLDQGDIEAAIEAAEGIKWEYFSSRAFAQINKALWLIEDFDRAQALIHKISNKKMRKKALFAYHKNLKKLGRQGSKTCSIS